MPPVRLLEGTRPLYPRIHPLIPPGIPRATAPRRGVSQGLVSFRTVFARIRRLGLSAVSVRKNEAALVARRVPILRVGSLADGRKGSFENQMRSFFEKAKTIPQQLGWPKSGDRDFSLLASTRVRLPTDLAD